MLEFTLAMEEEGCQVIPRSSTQLCTEGIQVFKGTFPMRERHQLQEAGVDTQEVHSTQEGASTIDQGLTLIHMEVVGR